MVYLPPTPNSNIPREDKNSTHICLHHTSTIARGIVGVACAAAASQIIGAILMLRSLGPSSQRIQSLDYSHSFCGELLQIIHPAGPVLLIVMSKVVFYTVITYITTSLVTITLGVHKGMIGVYSVCTVSGEPLAQTA